MKTRSELEQLIDYIKTVYCGWRLSVSLDSGVPWNKESGEPMGYCYKFTSPSTGDTIFRVVGRSIPGTDEMTDLRIIAHEFGHIYLGHLDGIHKTLDYQIHKTIEDDREGLEDYINKSCNINYADKLLNRILDDPELNHSLHNIAMDMEVNSKILSPEDIDIMEKEVTGFVLGPLEERLNGSDLSDSEKDELTKTLERLRNESVVKLIIPGRYHFPDGSPFPDGLTYSEYLLLIIQNLDQFIKMMISISQGGNGDTSDVSQQQVSDALNKQGGGDGQPGQEGQPGNGSGSGNPMAGLDELLNATGLGKSTGSQSDDESRQDRHQGTRGDGEEKDVDKKDHGSSDRTDADKERESGQLRDNAVNTGGVGCGSEASNEKRKVDNNVDEIDMAIDEVMNHYSKRTIRITAKKDLTYVYNRGINRKVFVPSIRQRVNYDVNPTIVFLIDVSGSMDTRLVDRILKTIATKMKKIQRGLKYNIISWNTSLCDHFRDLDPRKPVPYIGVSGGTRMAKGIEYFKEQYDNSAVLILISDFEDYLQEWHEVEKGMDGYELYGFNYGSRHIGQTFKNMKIRHFSND